MKTPSLIPSLSRFSRRLAVAAALVIALAWSARASKVEVNATLEPARIGLNEAAQLAVTVQGNQTAEPSLPRVDGLEFTSVGQSSSFQSINGAVSASVSYSYQVTATRAGTFHIPPIRVGSANTRPLVLQVLKKASGGSSPSANRSLPPPNVNWPSTPSPNTDSGKRQAAFLKVVAPKQEVYVGELMPVQIKAYFRRGMSASLNGLPTLSSDAFTMSKLTDKPDQSQEVEDGTAYTVLTWPSALSAVKAGDYSLNLELPVMVRVQERSARGQRRNPFKDFFGNSPFGNSPFNDSFFDDSFLNDFFGRVTEKPLTLQTELAAMKIVPLPTAGRPADFSGAVGQFQVQAEVTPTSATAGDPLTLKLVVSGAGNFDRVTSSGLPNSAGWKTYKPGARFEPTDSVGLEGRKIFEQAVVPEQSGHGQLPALAFSYFDPEARKYVTRQTQPLPMEVAAASGTPANVASAAPQKPTTPTSNPASSHDELFPNAIEQGYSVASLQPVLFRPGFVAVPATSLALLACGLWFVKRRDQRATDPAHARNTARAAALRENLAQMDSAVKSGEVTAFFASARRILQERLAQAWHVSPGAVTLAEINHRLNEAGEEICAVFRAADQTAYAGHGVSTDDLPQWREQVHEQLKHLEEL